MNQILLPKANNWNNYWKLDQTKQFTKISWSKRRIIEVITPFLKDKKTALDAGCGSGFFSKVFCDRGLVTTSLDYSESALNIAREKTQGKATLLKKDLTDPALPREMHERFDVIFSDGLLEHFIPEIQDNILSNFRNLLAPDGVVITFVPNRWSPWELIRPFYMPGIEEKPFILKDLTALHEKNHFRILKNGGINTVPFKFSPDGALGSTFGMLLYTIAKKK